MEKRLYFLNLNHRIMHNSRKAAMQVRESPLAGLSSPDSSLLQWN